MSDMSILRRMGHSDLFLSPIGLGCWQFSQGHGFMGSYWSNLSDQTITEIIRISRESGVNWFDTAEAYGKGQSERILAAGLKELNVKPADAIIATKWWPLLRTSRSIIKTINKRREALEPYPIALYQIHQPFSFSSIHSQMSAMAELVKEQKIRYIGVSNFSAAQMETAHDELQKEGFSLVSNQVRYHLMDRRIETNGILQTACKLGIAIISYSPLAQGILTGKFHHNPELLKNIGKFRQFLPEFHSKGLKKSQFVINVLQQLARKYGANEAQIALSWLIYSKGDSIFAIPGASTVEQAEENAKSMQVKLEKKDMEMLDELTEKYR
jgi:aryl-alcohol dehydrogenase-like predicted oxidoreductase